MDTPGVEVRDIPTSRGDHIIHEVFFRDVRVDESVRLGAENQGWPIVLASLANERIGIARFERLPGARPAVAFGRDVRRIRLPTLSGRRRARASRSTEAARGS